MNEKREPLEVLRDGSLKATFWLNESKNGPFISVTPGKTFEAPDGKLKDSNSYSGSDLLRMSELFRQAHTLNMELRKSLGLGKRSNEKAPEQTQAVQRTKAQTAGPSVAELTQKVRQSRGLSR